MKMKQHKADFCYSHVSSKLLIVTDGHLHKGVMWWLIVCVSLLCCSSEASVTCRTESISGYPHGKPVDWFIMYKVPKVNTFTGLEYYYIDSTGMPYTYHHDVFNHKLINHQAGVLANTLAPMFDPTTSNSKDFGFISYNDQYSYDKDPKTGNVVGGSGSASDKFGHSKGVVMMDKTNPTTSTGVWLLHSLPNFPFREDGKPFNANTFYPDNGKTNAQTFICVTFKYDQFKKIGLHLQQITAYPFDHHNIKNNPNFHQELQDVLKNRDTQKAKDKQAKDAKDLIQPLTSDKGRAFGSFAKKVSVKKADGDLYVTIANALQSPVAVQTWGGQACREDSYCQQNQPLVTNIDSVKTKLGNWGNGNDHSKWCITTDPKNRWTCIADSNRARTQFKRGGGALCIQDDNNVKVWDMFKGFIATIEGCPVDGDRGVIVSPPP